MVRIRCICMSFIAVFSFIGCNKDNAVNPSNTVDNSFVVPSTISLASSFKVKSCSVAKTSETSNYLSGVAEIEYTGAVPLEYVEAFVTYKSSSGSVLYKDTTYLRNETIVGSTGSSTYTNTFVSPDNPVAYYLFIEELSFSASSVANVEFDFTGETFTPADPLSQVALSGSSYVSNGMLLQNFTNNGTEAVNMEFSLFIFQNSSSVSYDWTYPDIFKKSGSGYVESDIIDTNSEGRLSTYTPTVYFETQPLSIKKTLLCWDPALVVQKRAVLSYSSPDARKKAIREMMDSAVDISRNK